MCNDGTISSKFRDTGSLYAAMNEDPPNIDSSAECKVTKSLRICSRSNASIYDLDSVRVMRGSREDIRPQMASPNLSGMEIYLDHLNSRHFWKEFLGLFCKLAYLFLSLV